MCAELQKLRRLTIFGEHLMLRSNIALLNILTQLRSLRLTELQMELQVINDALNSQVRPLCLLSLLSVSFNAIDKKLHSCIASCSVILEPPRVDVNQDTSPHPANNTQRKELLEKL